MRKLLLAFIVTAISASHCCAQGSPAVDFSHVDFSVFPALLNAVRLLFSSVALAALVLVALILWIFVSVFSPAPINVLKRKVAISAWIGLPAVAALAVWPASSGTFDQFAFITAPTFVWTNVFAGLFVGSTLRRRLLPGSKSPDPLSLPFAAVVFVIFATATLALLVEYGSSRFELLYAGGALLLFIILVGIALPADSNLIRANDRLGLLARRAYARTRAVYRRWHEQRKKEQEEQSKRNQSEGAVTVTDDASYPVPAIADAATVDAMRLKLRRSQRSSLMGKVVFVLDARMEITAEERELVRKYRLGDTVIYESSSRQQHRDAAIMHLDKTKDQARYRDSTGTQLLGAGKTLYRLARASISATAAALSLRITVSSLLSGVHIECKSMTELLGAETAILAAAEALRMYLETAATFDGREEIVEF